MTTITYRIEVLHLDGLWHEAGKLATHANGAWSYPRFDSAAEAAKAIDATYAAEAEAEAVRIVPVPAIVTARAYVGWTATRGDYDLDDHVAWGKTEADAVADLLDWEADEAIDAQCAEHDEWVHAAEHDAEQAEWRADYERDEAADAKRQARIDDAACDW